MTDQSPPMRRAMPAALVVARRAMVVAAASMVIAALAVVIALLGEPGTDPAETAALEQARDDAASAQDEADAANALADAAVVIAEEAKALAVAAEAALADAVASAGETVDPEVIAQLEVQLEEARNLAATALVAADAAAGATDAEAADAEAAEDGTEAEEVSEPEEAVVEDGDASGPDDEAAATEEDAAASGDDATATDDASEPVDTGAAAALPGEPSEFGPSAGTGLAVVGIRHDSALNFRDIPNGTVIARLDNVMDGVRDPAVYVRQPGSDDIIDTVDLQNGVVATGNTRQLPTTIWHELQVGDLLGWASSTFLAPLGAPRDAIDEVTDGLGGTPTAETLGALGRRVAGLFESTGEVQSQTTISSRPSVFEAVGDITLDVLGLPDDALRGYRIHITADSGAEDWTQGDGGPFTLRSVTVTPICDSHRGANDDGVCN